MAEYLVVRNCSMVSVECELRLEFGADFADIAEIEGTAAHAGTTRRAWDAPAGALTFDHRARHGSHHLHRALRIRVVASDSPPRGRRDALWFTLRLPPEGTWTATLAYDSLVDEAWR